MRIHSDALMKQTPGIEHFNYQPEINYLETTMTLRKQKSEKNRSPAFIVAVH